MTNCIQEKVIKTRKLQHCCECGEAVYPGMSYRVISGVWDNCLKIFRQCLSCGELFEKSCEDTYLKGYDPSDGPQYGELKEWIDGD